MILCRDRFITLCEYEQGQLAEMLAPGEVSLNVRRLRHLRLSLRGGRLFLDRRKRLAGHEREWQLRHLGQHQPRGSDLPRRSKVDEFFLKILSLPPDDPQRYALGQEAERYLLQENAYGVPLFTQLGVIAYRTYVKGVRVPEVNVNLNLDRSTFWLDK